MVRELAIALTIAAVGLAGCSPSHRAPTAPTVTAAATQDSTSPQATMVRLQGERLPALVSVGPWEGKYGPGLKLTTQHYEIFSTVTQPLLLRMVPGFIESAYRSYNDQLPQAIDTAYPLPIYLFADRRQWEAFTCDFAGPQASIFCKIKTGAYCLNGACVVYDLGPQRTLAALGHEGWHQFNSRHFQYRLPSWLDEGVAMQFEAGIGNGGFFRFDPSGNIGRLRALQVTLDQGKSLPLRDLVATSPGEALATDEAEAVMTFYSQSYALIRFLCEADSGRYLDSYHRLLSDGLTGRWPLDRGAGVTAADRNLPRTLPWNRQVGRQLFEHYLGPDLDQLEHEYVAFCHRIARNFVVTEMGENAQPALTQ